MRNFLLALSITLVLFSCSDDDNGGDPSGGGGSNPTTSATLVVNNSAITTDSAAVIAGGQGYMSVVIGTSLGESMTITAGFYSGLGTYNFTDGNLGAVAFIGAAGFFAATDEDEGSGSLIITDHNTSSNLISGEFAFTINDFTGTDSVMISGDFTNLQIYPSYVQSQSIDASINGNELVEDDNFTFEDQSGGNTVFIRSIKDIGESVNINVKRSSTTVGTMVSGDFFSGPGPSVQYTVDGMAYDSTPGEGTFTITSYDPGVPFSEPGSITMSMNVPVTDGTTTFQLTGTVDATFGPE